MPYQRNVPAGVEPGDPHPLRPHWTLLPQKPGEDYTEDEWIRDDGGHHGFSFCPSDEERVARFDDYDERFPMGAPQKFLRVSPDPVERT